MRRGVGTSFAWDQHMITAVLILVSALQAQAQPAGSDPLRAFDEYVRREWPGERTQQEINCRALELMVNAVEAVAAKRRVGEAKSMESAARVRERRQDYCSGNPADREQPRKLRRTLIEASELIEKLAESVEQRKFTAHVNALNRAAESLDEAAPLRRQPDVMERFFHHGAELLVLLDR
jgi:hypothetical protein